MAFGRVALVAVLGFVAGIGLQGCAGTSGVSDELNAQLLAKSNTGIAVMRMGISGQSCPNATVALGKKTADGYELAQHVKMSNSWLVANDVAQVELPPGEYHIVSWSCVESSGNTTRTRTLGQKEGSVLGFGGTYKKSFGSFELATGEIVNIGYIRMIEGALGGVFLDVSALPAEALAKFRKDKPNLSSQMVDRPLKQSRVPLTPQQQKVQCEMIAVLIKNGINDRMVPPECAAIAGTAAKPAPAVAPKPAAPKTASNG